MSQALKPYERTAALLREVRALAKVRNLTCEALRDELNKDYLSPSDAISGSTAVKVLKRKINTLRSELFAALQCWVVNNQDKIKTTNK